MKLLLIATIFSLLWSCTDAANNKRGGNDDDGSRRTQRNVNPDLDSTDILRSQAYRTQGKKQISYAKLTAQISTNSSELDYRTIPQIEDHDGSVKYNNHNQSNCGIVVDVQTINARKNNCLKVNGDDAVWSGEEFGISGEGSWALIHKQGDVEVWQDLTTSLLWATPTTSGNWNEASGQDVKDSEYLCGQLKLLSASEVKWMLPTRNEFLLADINGARFVLSKTDDYYWTATAKEQSGEAWTIKQETGELKTFGTNVTRAVRCVGIPL